MTGQEAVAYIHSFQWQRHAPGLDRIRALLHALGDPQRGMKFVHVAGTNGKGSTCAMIAAILEAAGYRVGLNTSPYLEDFRERIQINGEMIPEAALAALVKEIRPAAEAMADHPTEFELITAIALLHFRREQCDIAVLEVGLGGALDASNVIDTPEVAVLAAMGLDHTAVLGPTLTDIAIAKAGIIKPGGTVVSLGDCPEADAVFRRVCRERGAVLTEVDFARLGGSRVTLSGTEFDLTPYGPLRLGLIGEYQLRNAALAVTAAEVLRDKGWRLPEEAIRRGLEQARWPGRMEVIRPADPVILLEGAHNPQGAAAAAETLRALFPDRKIVLLLGMLADKDVEGVLEAVVPLAEAVVTVTPPSPRALDAEALRRRLPYGTPGCACLTVEEGVKLAVMAAGPGGAVCALGSLYMSGAVRQAAAALNYGAEP
ncbi:bifunctional folylpolyglutamate synthase/dihydrofolate synthase [Dysosmobacter sp.]|uniref:bifunctional folylpolyglutamate synthase/dihydrofolate synthase n=1 Tax=Dysosmobacter sp. TaxID=2591382 RepID=UPI002A93700D|nr:folylpolyglutamate synthase/dihydrofolate synthase family protein [Dysosmobacter sp.]MCI6055050.1 bifunctional folylpolyglutamate synthase/dihydrofolate synthase [Dysosmobacter sp.]MDY5510785.1 folylpolyglutamate synthase/dihydrofolate synthase family protein [Dysosmobacter sp.]